MANEKSLVPAKFDKKATRHIIEKAIEQAIAGINMENDLSKQLHKKIKKAGKLVTEGLHENLQKTSQLAKKAVAPKKVAAKKVVVKKAIVKKVAPKKAAAKKALKK